MDYDEIRRYLDVSLAHSISIDVRDVLEAPGNVRTVTIHRDARVTIEFQKSTEYSGGDYEGSGLKYVGKYDSVDDAVRGLEKYLARPMHEWRNYTRDRYDPVVKHESPPAENLAYFEGLVRERKMPLPEGGNFQLAGIYWRHIQRYGEYRQDKLIEEQDLTLTEHGFDPD
jgi:hypothetical protein